MKIKTTVTDAKTGKKTTSEKTLRNVDHFEVQLKTRAHAFRDKTKYTRKEKHKSRDF